MKTLIGPVQPRICQRCGGTNEYIVGPIINGRGRSLGVCYRCRGRIYDPVQKKSVCELLPRFNFTYRGQT